MSKENIYGHSADIKTDINLLGLYILNSSSQSLEENNITPFESGDKVYAYTTEKLSKYGDKDLNNKKVLSVTSSGDHILNAILHSAKEVVGFDINRFCKYYSALKIAMIKKYDYNEFFDKYSLVHAFGNDYETRENLNFDKLLDDVSIYLSHTENVFWSMFNNLIKTTNFKKGFFNIDIFKDTTYDIPWGKKNAYLYLKDKLINDCCNVKYIDSNINTLLEKTNDKFDLIFMSNILGRMRFCKNSEKINLFLYLMNLLEENGIIYSYDFYAIETLTPTHELLNYFDIEPSLSTCNVKVGEAIVRSYKKK